MTVARVAVVLNAKAGALLDQPGKTMDDTLAEALSAAGLQAELIPPDAGPLPDRLARALAAAPDAVLVAGGDGTVACAAQLLAGTAMPLALLPLGTMNLLAKDVGLPPGDVAAVVRSLTGGHTRTIDVGDVNGQAFLCASMLGLPAQLGRHREASRGSSLRLWSRMARATWNLLAQGRRLHVAVTVDGTPTALAATALTVTVNPVDEAAGRSFGRSCLDGGTLGLYVARRLRPWDLARLAARSLFGSIRADDALTEHHATTIDIASGSRAMQVMNDGELMLLQPPLRYRVRPAALHVMVPDA